MQCCCCFHTSPSQKSLQHRKSIVKFFKYLLYSLCQKSCKVLYILLVLLPLLCCDINIPLNKFFVNVNIIKSLEQLNIDSWIYMNTANECLFIILHLCNLVTDFQDNSQFCNFSFIKPLVFFCALQPFNM